MFKVMEWSFLIFNFEQIHDYKSFEMQQCSLPLQQFFSPFVTVTTVRISPSGDSFYCEILTVGVVTKGEISKILK
jgi:hypothetical protein